MKVLAIWGLLGMVALTLSAQNTITIEGVVVDTVTGAGIRDATVWLTANGATTAGPRQQTNHAGEFRIAGVKPGDYTAGTRKQGYFDTPQLHLHVSVDGSPIHLRLELIPPAIVHGRVLGIDGKPARATVELGPGSGKSAMTNEDGYFTFEQLPPGSYTLLGSPEPADPAFPEGFRTAVVPTYYPSALDRIQAESITVRAGTDLSGYEIRLQSASVYRVSGVVLDPAGNPAPNAVVQLLKVANKSTDPWQIFSIRRSPLADAPGALQSTTTEDDGTFEFSSVRPGDWTVRVESDSIRDEVHQRDVVLFGSTAISLGHRDLDDLSIRLVTPIDISGTVERGDASPDIAPFAEVTLTGESGYFGGTAHADANGTLRLEGIIPGRYLISGRTDGNNYASVLMGSSDVTEQTVELTAASPPIRIVVKRGGTIRWTVESSSSWTVLWLPQSLTGFGYSVSSVLGRSELTGIPPGDYYAIAIDNFNPYTMAEPRLRELVPRATSVRIEPGSVSFVQVKVNHAPD